jgi:hypothetical protein
MRVQKNVTKPTSAIFEQIFKCIRDYHMIFSLAKSRIVIQVTILKKPLIAT